MRGTASEGYRVNDLFVPEAYSGTREDPSLRRDPGPLYAFTMQGLYAVGVASVAMGIARAMLDAFITLAAEKTPRGLQRMADSGLAELEASRGAGHAAVLDDTVEHDEQIEIDVSEVHAERVRGGVSMNVMHILYAMFPGGQPGSAV